VDPVPDPLLLRKSGSAGDRTRDLCICSQKLWPLDHRGGQSNITGYIILTRRFRPHGHWDQPFSYPITLTSRSTPRIQTHSSAQTSRTSRHTTNALSLIKPRIYCSYFPLNACFSLYGESNMHFSQQSHNSVNPHLHIFRTIIFWLRSIIYDLRFYHRWQSSNWKHNSVQLQECTQVKNIGIHDIWQYGHRQQTLNVTFHIDVYTARLYQFIYLQNVPKKRTA